MAVARSTGVLLGTSESSGVTIANNAAEAGSEVDVLGGDDAAGVLDLYLVFTSTVTAGSIDVRVNRRRVTGEAYQQVGYSFGVPPLSGTRRVHLGRVPASRFMSADVLNNATGANATNVFVGYELHKVS
jgi:hypothetical protein